MTRLRAEGGFTLIEMLVSLVLVTIVFGAVLGALNMFQRQANAASQRGSAQDMARRAMDEMASRLRGAMGSGTSAALTRALGNDVVFQMVDPANPPVSAGSNAAHLMYLRLCVDSTAQKLYEETYHWSTATAPSPPDSTAGPAFPCPGTGWDTSNLLADHVVTPGGAIFSFSPSASSVARVNVDLTIDMDPTKEPPATELQSAISLRNLNRPPSVVLSCAAVGSGQVVCDSFGSADPDGGALTYAWSYGTSCASMSTIAGATLPQLNQPQLSAGQYCFGLTVTDPTGMSASATQLVTAR